MAAELTRNILGAIRDNAVGVAGDHAIVFSGNPNNCNIYTGDISVPENVHDREVILFQDGKMEVTKLEEGAQLRSPILRLRSLDEMQQDGVGYTEGGISSNSLNGENPGWIAILESMGCSLERRWQAGTSDGGTSISVELSQSRTRKACIMSISQLAGYALMNGCTIFPKLKYAFEGCELNMDNDKINFYKRDNQFIGGCLVEFQKNKGELTVMKWGELDLFVRTGTTNVYIAYLIYNPQIIDFCLLRKIGKETKIKGALITDRAYRKLEERIKSLKSSCRGRIIRFMEKHSECMNGCSFQSKFNSLNLIEVNDYAIYWLSTGYSVAVA